MEGTPLLNRSDSTSSQQPTRRRLVVSSMVLVAVSCGIGIGVLISNNASAGQESHMIKVNRSIETPSRAVSAAMALSEAFSQVAQVVEPAVVHIETSSSPSASTASAPLDFFHPRRRQRGEGSGILVDPSGYILTNHHVIVGAESIQIRLSDGRTFTPQTVGVDPETDLAVLKITDTDPLPHATIGDSADLKVGDWVLAIGSPFGLEQSVTAGIISAKDRATAGPHANFHQFLQTDAAINPGNSGGPLVNLMGQVVGINSQISTSTGTSNGVGFAVPSSIAIDVYNQIVTSGRVERGWLGILLDEVTPEIANVYGLEYPHGALIHDIVDQDSPAGQAGLQSADIIVGYDGQMVKDQRHLTRLVAATEVDRTVSITVLRNGRRLTFPIKIAARAAMDSLRLPQERSEPPRVHRKAELGAKLAPMSAELARELNLPVTQGVMISEVQDGSLAQDLGLQPQDVVLRLNRQPVGTPDQLIDLVERLGSGDDLVLEVLGPRRKLGKPGHSVLSTVIP